jgi:hypothetical protein
MTVQVDIVILIFLVVVIIFAAILLPMIWQWKKNGKETAALLSELRRELIPTLKDFREITERINRASVKIEKGSGHAETLSNPWMKRPIRCARSAIVFVMMRVILPKMPPTSSWFSERPSRFSPKKPKTKEFSVCQNKIIADWA